MRVLTVTLTHLPAAGKIAVTRPELALLTGLTPHVIDHAITRLVARGLATRAQRGRYRRTAAGDQIAAAGVTIKSGATRRGVDAALSAWTRLRKSDENRSDGLRDRAWSALRMLRKATIPELLELALREEAPAPARAKLSEYLNALDRCYVVARLPRRVRGTSPSSRGFVQWLLVWDLGPRAPVVRHDGSVIDRNKNKTLPARAR